MIDIKDEYRTIVSGVGWIDRSERGRLRFAGTDALAFLQALVTNDVSRLNIGEGMYAAYLTPQGRMLTDLELYRRPAGMLAAVVPGVAESLTKRLDQLIFAEDVQITDDSARVSEILIVGGRAPEFLSTALELDQQILVTLAELSQVDWRDGFVARAGESVLPNFSIFVPSARQPELLALLARHGVPQLSHGLVEALRIEAGRPRFGVDMTEDTIPLEAGLLERAISTTKGCYVGQEIVVRILHRGGGRVAKRLALLRIETDELPRPGGELEGGGRAAGYLTSVAVSPSGGAIIGLGYVHRDLAEVGQRLNLVGSTAGGSAVVTGFAQ